VTINIDLEVNGLINGAAFSECLNNYLSLSGGLLQAPFQP
jgi:hypothetical protein